MAQGSAVELTIEPRTRDLGGFSVGRVLPYAKRRSVGPFVFFDEIGPADFAPGDGVDVRPHPHIGLATVTYLFDGELRHRDNLGFDQTIRPGDVNWMTAGRGVVHSERVGGAARQNGQRLYGVQSWVALPEADEDADPSFHHHPKDTLPTREADGATLRVIAGAAYGLTAPTRTFSPMFYIAADLDAGATLAVPDEYEERAVYILSGEARIDDAPTAPRTMAVLSAGARAAVTATTPTRLMLLGGAPIGPRTIWWNFVASDPAKIAAAQADWRGAAANGFSNGRFTLPPDEREFIPLPDDA